MVADECHQTGKGNPLPAHGYFFPFGKALFLYLTSKHFSPSC